jgi:hypothetical protein
VQDISGLGEAADIDDLHEILQPLEVHFAVSRAPRRSTYKTIIYRQSELVLALMTRGS